MPKKRKNSGKNKDGKDVLVTCDKCNRLVPRSKAKRVTRRTNLMEGVIEKELRQAGAVLPNVRSQKWLCISCAVHGHVVGIRERDNRKDKPKL